MTKLLNFDFFTVGLSHPPTMKVGINLRFGFLVKRLAELTEGLGFVKCPSANFIKVLPPKIRRIQRIVLHDQLQLFGKGRDAFEFQAVYVGMRWGYH